MKATIELDDALYRRLKVEAALRGRPVKALIAEGVQRVLGDDGGKPEASGSAPREVGGAEHPEWFGALRQYAKNAHGDHSLAAMRRSVEIGRAGKTLK